jgi:hypothetical protein
MALRLWAERRQAHCEEETAGDQERQAKSATALSLRKPMSDDHITGRADRAAHKGKERLAAEDPPSPWLRRASAEERRVFEAGAVVRSV